MCVLKVDKQILKRLEFILTDSNMNKKEIAYAFGLSPSTISEIYCGRIKSLSNPLLKVMELEKGVNVEWLKTGKGEPYILTLKVKLAYEIELLFNYRSGKTK